MYTKVELNNKLPSEEIIIIIMLLIVEVQVFAFLISLFG